MLGGALLRQKKHTAVVPLLLKGYAGMKQREKTIPPRGKVNPTQALQRLAQLDKATGKKDDADEWRKELETGKAPARPKLTK